MLENEGSGPEPGLPEPPADLHGSMLVFQTGTSIYVHLRPSTSVYVHLRPSTSIYVHLLYRVCGLKGLFAVGQKTWLKSGARVLDWTGLDMCSVAYEP